jgi:type IV fimbrial biogenesis protein FimT
MSKILIQPGKPSPAKIPLVATDKPLIGNTSGASAYCDEAQGLPTLKRAQSSNILSREQPEGRDRMLVRQRTKGFTLFELIIALAIGSIVLVVGIPSFSGTLDNQRMTSATNELVMSLNLAKSEAIKRVTYVSVCRSNNGTSCTGGGTSWDDGWIVFANATVANLGSVDAEDEIIRVYPALRDELTVTPTGTIAGFVSFRPSGTIGTSAANMTGTLTACDERGADHARGISVESSGQWHVSHDLAHDGAALTC